MIFAFNHAILEATIAKLIFFVIVELHNYENVCETRKSEIYDDTDSRSRSILVDL